MPYNNLIVSVDEGVATLTLDRPEVLNALSEELYSDLDTAVADLDASDDVRVMVFTASGDRAFSAGADIHEMARLAETSDGSGVPQRTEEQEWRAWRIASTVKPSIGAINGLAYGGGAVLATTFDIRVGCENSSFRFLAASYGRVNSTWSLPMQVGWPMAKELLFTARVVEAKEAFRIGLLNHLVPRERLMDATMEIARQIAANDPRMVAGIKGLLVSDVGAGWRRMYEAELEARGGPLKPTPVLEGFRDFLSRKGSSHGGNDT